MPIQSPPSEQRSHSDEATRPQDACDPSHPHGPSFQNPTKIGKFRSKAKKHHLKLLGPVKVSPTTTPSTTSSTEIPFLLRLPGEIRNLIYSYALTSPTSSLIYNASEMRFPLHDIGFGLMSSCHALALETQYQHFKLNRLVFVVNQGTIGNIWDYITVMKNLGRLADAKGWAIHVEFRFSDASIILRVRSSSVDLQEYVRVIP
ncbi:hypothetical protein COCVIDRAFT_93474 [Bipolaris victoriae FI3]|uniref:Uncharacterized protein n=1 Tax=Bipolaris victoriae (strain FI3) TaxID=930091 RepID=W7EFD2_BIPV3|nr:hypothetical protein COCVIDRAFT_93474 [Bipolaris victoriae FI3]